MTAVTTQFLSEVTKCTGKKSKFLPNVLTAGWSYMNNGHMRTRVSKGASALQLAGTTSNEALHAELRAAFRQVYDMHVPVMRLKRNCFVLSKLVVFQGEPG